MPFMALMPLSGTSCSIHIGIPASVAIPKMWRGMKRCEEIYRDVSLTYPANAVVSEWGQSLQCDKFKRERERGNKKNQIIEIESTIPFPQLLCACSSGQVANDFLRLTGTASLFSLVAASCPLCALASCFASWRFETMVASCHISSSTLSSISICHVLKHIETYWNYLWSSLIFRLHVSPPLDLALSHSVLAWIHCHLHWVIYQQDSTSVHVHHCSPIVPWKPLNDAEPWELCRLCTEHCSEVFGVFGTSFRAWPREARGIHVVLLCIALGAEMPSELEPLDAVRGHSSSSCSTRHVIDWVKVEMMWLPVIAVILGRESWNHGIMGRSSDKICSTYLDKSWQSLGSSLESFIAAGSLKHLALAFLYIFNIE